ncbi:hypothetical protein LJK87_20110 [Paenibacillus sp. P25]|nr:hypothetical protein LJK87_20110 [Paenibacillus sp. P25]
MHHASGTAGSKRFIGIDGGGTKTVCLIGDEEGRVLARCQGARAICCPGRGMKCSAFCGS